MPIHGLHLMPSRDFTAIYIYSSFRLYTNKVAFEHGGLFNGVWKHALTKVFLLLCFYGGIIVLCRLMLFITKVLCTKSLPSDL